MATRMQQRRGTAAQWTAANPILAAGEIGFETDTNKFKMGNGSSAWSALQYFANAAELAAIIDGAPDLLNTLGELADAIGGDPDFLTELATISGVESAISESRSISALDATSKANGAIAAAALDATEKANAVEEAASVALSNHEIDTTNVHGIADTSLLATKNYADGAVSNHNTEEMNVHGIENTASLATKDYTDTAITTAVSELTKSVVGLDQVDNTSDANKPVSTAQATAIADAVSDHNLDETNVHGIADTAELVTQTQLTNAISGAEVDQASLAGVGLDWNAGTDQFDIDETHITTATQTALDLKAPLANPTFTGTVSGITKSMVGLANVDNTTDADKPVSTATQTALNAKLNLSGGTLTGALTLSGAPTSDLHAATKQYVDGLAAGINFHQPVVAASAGNLSGVYDNGTNGVGATLTASANGAIGTIDGASVSVGNRILLRAQTDATQNGIYTVTNVGGASAKWVVTRAADADNNPSGELATGDFVFVTSGSTNGSKGYILSTTGTITIGTTNVNYAQFNASEAVTAGTNITKSGSTIAVADAPTFSGAVTASSGIVFSDGTQTKVGVPSITTFATAISSSATLAAGEADKFVPLTGAVTITLPATGYSTGQSIDFYQASGTGAQFASTNSVVGTPGLKFRTTNSVVTAMKTSSGWLVFGDLSA